MLYLSIVYLIFCKNNVKSDVLEHQQIYVVKNYVKDKNKM